MRMRTLFTILALVAVGVMVYTFSLGWRYHYGTEALDKQRAAGEVVDESESEAIGNLIPKHFVWGMLTGVYVCFVHSLVLVYFIGTGRAIDEQTELQNWDQADFLHSKKLMARALMPASLGILLLIFAAFSGGFTMIGMAPPLVHLAIAALGILAQIPIFFWQYTLIYENGKLMDKILERLDGPDIRIAL